MAFAVGLALNGVILLLTRCYFALQHVWAATALALVNLVVAAGLSLALHGPCGVWGIPLANSIANIVVVPLMWIILSRRVGRLDDRGVLLSTLLSLAGSVVVGLVAYALWAVLHDLLGSKTRTVLIVLSMAVGLFAVGIILSARATPTAARAPSAFARSENCHTSASCGTSSPVAALTPEIREVRRSSAAGDDLRGAG